MIQILTRATLTANGDYSFPAVANGCDVRLEWCITMGSATVIPGYVDLAGNFKPSRGLDGVLPVFDAAGGMCDVGIGNSSQAAISVEDAAGLSMTVCQTPIPR